MAEFDEKLNALLSDQNAMAQIMQLAQSLNGGGATSPESTPQQTAPPPAAPPLHGPDPQMMARLMPLLSELGGQQDTNARTLLLALRPYLRPERQEKVERALQLARLFCVGKKFLAGWGK